MRLKNHTIREIPHKSRSDNIRTIGLGSTIVIDILARVAAFDADDVAWLKMCGFDLDEGVIGRHRWRVSIDCLLPRDRSCVEA